MVIAYQSFKFVPIQVKFYGQMGYVLNFKQIVECKHCLSSVVVVKDEEVLNLGQGRTCIYTYESSVEVWSVVINLIG